MNREIKFRAWDKEKNMFVPYGEIIFKDYGETSIEVIPNCMEYIGDKVHNGKPQYSRFDIQQFTGLKDKNGVDIYLDDLHKDFEGDVFKVIQMDCGRYALQMLSNNYVDEFIDWSETEIIGNIHSNPELIK